MAADDPETITVGELSPGPPHNGSDSTAPVSLPVVELLTGRGFITGKSGAGKSVLEGTPVYTATGYRPIETITTGERVLSLDMDTGQPCFRPVTATLAHTDDRLLRVSLADGTELVGTADHSFLTRDDGSIHPTRGDALAVGDVMPGCTPPDPEIGDRALRGDGGAQLATASSTPTAVNWLPVTAITPVPGTAPVYDLSVAGTNTFLANGVFVHNSNTASVVLEDLLANNFPCFIIDADGEYYGLKETYEILHAGADEECDITVSPEHAEKLASLALEENIPIILDISGYLDRSAANQLVRETARHLFAKEKKLKKPFLVVVEEIHEHIPERGGLDDTGRMLIKIGKRGRKHGLGLLGISQRPADVKKDFITQANWLVWHRLTWDNDTRVAGRVIGDEYAEAIPELGDGEAFLQTDWTDTEIRRVQFRRKRTFDAGATPGLDDFERPELKSVSDGLLSELESITDRQQQRQDRIEQLQAQLDQKERRIEELQSELEQAHAVSTAAENLVTAIDDRLVDATTAPAGNSQSDLADRVAALEAAVETLADRVDDIAADRSTSTDTQTDQSAADETTGELASVLDAALPDSADSTSDSSESFQSADTGSSTEEPLPEIELAEAFDPWPTPETTQASGGTVDLSGSQRRQSPGSNADSSAAAPASDHSPIHAAVEASTCPSTPAWTIIEHLQQTPASPTEVATAVAVPAHHVWTFLVELRQRDIATRDTNGRYHIKDEFLEFDGDNCVSP